MTNKTRLLILTTVLFVMLAGLVPVGSLSANEKVVWQIGTLDRNYGELAITQDFSTYTSVFPNDVTFRINKDDPSKSWPYFHPGPMDGWAGARVHPFTILFELSDEPRGLMRLSINLMNAFPSETTTYEIDANDHKCALRVIPPPSGSGLSIDAALPASFFSKGENKIVLKCTEGSWVQYDSLQLTNDPDVLSVEPNCIQLSLTPTFRFVRRGSKLKQIVRLSAAFSFDAENRFAIVKIGDTSTQVKLRPNSLFTDIEVDEVTKPVLMEAAVTSGGQTKSVSCELRPEKHWNLYVQASSHVDIGYTDLQERVADLHNKNTSLALDLCGKYPDFKWNTEAAWVEDNYLTMMPSDRKSEFINMAQKGRIGCPVLYGSMLTGLCSHEELIRTLYFSHSAARKYGIPFDIAMSSDVPTLVWTLPTILAGSGIRYLSAGLNMIRADSFNKLFSKSPFYWQGPDGSKVLTWFAASYAQAFTLGLDSDLDRAGDAVESFIRGFDRKDYPYDAVLAFGGYTDNRPLNAQLAPVVAEWNKTYAYPKIIFSRGTEFFKYVESRFKNSIPTISGDAGVYWEDGAGSSAYETSLVRNAAQNLTNAEKLLALTAKTYPVTDINAAWKNIIIYDEHIWGAAGSISEPESAQTVEQWKRKSQFAQSAYSSSEKLLNRAVDGLIKKVQVRKPSIIVFNPMSWTVSGVVNVKSTDGELVQFWAQDIAPMSYKIYPIPQTNSSGVDSEKSGKTVLENRFYRVEFDAVTGAVKHLFDKDLNRDLIDPSSPYGANQYLYYAGQGKDLRETTRPNSDPPVALVKRTLPYGSSMRIRGTAFNTPECVSEVILYDKIKRIDFDNTMDKTPTYEKEAGYFAFPFALNRPVFRIQLPNGVVRPDREMLDGACMAWYCTQDFVVASDSDCAIVWTSVDSPLVTLSDINRETPQGPWYTAGTKWPVPITNGHLFAYVFNNYWFTNYKASQGGKLRFRFSLTSMKDYDPVAASKFGASVRNPLLAAATAGGPVTSGVGQRSFLNVEPENLLIQSIKKAESGDGLVIRLREVSGKQTIARLAIPSIEFKEAWLCNLVEDPQKKLKISAGKIEIPIRANGLATVKVSR
ncbi:MAG: glycoside hydrolase family 38 N-terminal domain-containing protein [Armatimonadota bacterium]